MAAGACARAWGWEARAALSLCAVDHPSPPLSSSPPSPATLTALATSLEADAGAAAAQALRLAAVRDGTPDGGRAPRAAEVSLVLTDDAEIAQLNQEWRGVAGPTDVLSFPMDDPLAGAASGGADPASLPPRVLGDLVLSLDTATRQAGERGHPLRAECRILLVHGCLHLVGFDHETDDPADAAAMAAAEGAAVGALGWGGAGLIESASARTPPPTPRRPSSSRRRPLALALDLDGTLLAPDSRPCAAGAAAAARAAAAGVAVVIATGKARPAARAALAHAGLDGVIVGDGLPGVFLQGLTSYGRAGARVGPDACLPPDVVAAAFRYGLETGVPCVGFTGDHCVALEGGEEVDSLHAVYHEPRAAIAPSLAVLLAGPPVLKLLFLAPPETVDAALTPHWAAALAGTRATTARAVPDMLELVPRGVTKWDGVAAVLRDLGIHPDDLVAVGDGANDAEMLAGAGVGVAMGNAGAAARAAAGEVVAGNGDGGVAEAIDRFVLF